MNRKAFIKICSILGIGAPLQLSITSCGDDDLNDPSFTGTVLIIGAGAAGMAAGYLLAQRGIEFQILEATSSHGGRFKQNTTFADFPIPLGAEWLETGTEEFSRIVNDASVDITTQTQAYDLQADLGGIYDGNNLTLEPLSSLFGADYADRKFIGTSWFGFFDTYIYPMVQNRVTFNTEITNVDYSGDQVQATTTDGQTFSADRLILTVPLKILQEGDLSFTPALPSSKRNAISSANIWGGIKVFLKFTSNFYPTFLGFNDSENNAGQRVYYDAAYGQNTNLNILGLFAVGEQAEPYQALTGDELRDYILAELDTVFGNNIATDQYLEHMVQNWNEAPYAKGAYLADVAPSSTSIRMATSVDNKLYFAGTAYTQEDDWGSVHHAARSARDAVAEVLNS